MIEDRVHLPDGRVLSYGDWGPRDAPVIMYCHGFPGNRLELLLALQQVDPDSVPVRIVALDRPGFGESTFQPNRTFLDWPVDVATAANQLDIDNFTVLGVSGGSPYALACGYAMPERVSRVGVVVGVAPLEAPSMDQANIVSGMSAIAAVRRLQLMMMGLAFRRGKGDRILEKMPSTMCETDRTVLARPEVQDWFIALMQEAFVQGAQGAVHEAGLYRAPWGFDVAQVSSKTQLWYGAADETVPADVGLWLSRQLPGAQYTVWPEHGHFSWMQSDEASKAIKAMAGKEQPA